MSQAVNTAVRLIRFPEVRARVGLCRTSVFEMVRRGEFPRPIPIGARAVAWSSVEIDAWIARRVQQAKAAA